MAERRREALGDAGLRRIRRLYEDGVEVVEIAKVLGCDRRTVLRHVAAMGLDDRRGGPKLTAGQIEYAAELYQSGATLKELGGRFGVHGDTVRRHLVEAGVEIRLAVRPSRPTKLTADQLEECRRRVEDGETITGLAAEIGVHRVTLRRNLDRLG